MRRAVFISLCFHGLLLLAIIIGLPRFGERLSEPEMIVVDVIETEPQQAKAPEPERPPEFDPPAATAPLPERQATSVAPPPPPEPVPEVEAELEVAAEPAPAPEPAPEPPPAPTVQARSEPAPAPPEPIAAETPREKEPPPQPAVPRLAPRQPSVAEPEIARVEAPPKPAPVIEPAPTVKTEVPPVETTESEQVDEEEDEFAALLRSVEQLDRRLHDQETRDGRGKARDTAAVPSTDPAQNNQTLSQSELAYIKRQIEGCWRVPAGVSGVQDMQVELRIVLNRDSSVQRVEIYDQTRARGDYGFRAVAESAQRAVLTCDLDLPAEKYDQWRDIIMVFDPGNALSG